MQRGPGEAYSLHKKTFEDNSTLEGILGEVILPNVRAKEMALREKGLVSLGLCCLIAKVGAWFFFSCLGLPGVNGRVLFGMVVLQRMALSSFQLFVNQVQAAPELLKVRVLKIVFDILMVHEGEFLGRPGDAVSRCIVSDGVCSRLMLCWRWCQGREDSGVFASCT